MPTDEELMAQAIKMAEQGQSPLNSKRGQYSQGSIITGKSPTISEHLKGTLPKSIKEEMDEPISMTEGGQGFVENATRFGASIVNNAGAAVEDLLGSVIDAGDWHHYLPSDDTISSMTSGSSNPGLQGLGMGLVLYQESLNS